MRATVEIRYRPGVLDPEAQAIHKALAGLGFTGITAVRRTRVLELDLAATDAAAAEAEVRRMCDRLLANPVIETFRIEMQAAPDEPRP